LQQTWRPYLRSWVLHWLRGVPAKLRFRDAVIFAKLLTWYIAFSDYLLVSGRKEGAETPRHRTVREEPDPRLPPAAASRYGESGVPAPPEA
jgi:hypothetical protein